MLLAEFPFLESWNAVIISLCVVATEVPHFELQLSCFGHVRAKTNSELPCRLELCLTFRLGDHSRLFVSSQVCGGIVLLLVCSGFTLGMCWLSQSVKAC